MKRIAVKRGEKGESAGAESAEVVVVEDDAGDFGTVETLGGYAAESVFTGDTAAGKDAAEADVLRRIDKDGGVVGAVEKGFGKDGGGLDDAKRR